MQNHWRMLGIIAGAAAALGIVLGLLVAARARRRTLLGARAQADALRRSARAAALVERRQAEIAAREETLAARAAAEAEVGELGAALERREEHATRREQALGPQEERLAAASAALAARLQALEVAQARTRELKTEVRRCEDEAWLVLERIAGQTRAQLKAELCQTWVEEARAAAAARLRAIDQNAADPDYARQAKRLMGIAIQRYQGHYLTERLLSTIVLGPALAARFFAEGAAIVKEIEEQSQTKLTLSDAGDGVRIEGADGVGREIARRVIHRLMRSGGGDRRGPRPAVPEITLDLNVREPKRLVQTVVQNLDRELVDLGKKAFAELELPKAHPDIVKLVGRLHYRTSYTQNQWKHSVEAAFLAGLIAEELGLDRKLARRATLLHDIGKALSHEVDGSHAVIGADWARRLGESDVIANAIGAHHGDETCESVYAFLVAAADALSGARPGARREMVETYVKRIADLERIAQGFAGIDRVYAVQAGREVRVHVFENQVSDSRATEMASAIAQRISRELTFPGQIKVMVIRELRAVELAG
jgi:ribonuclease Y